MNDGILSIITSVGLGGIIAKWAWNKFMGSASKKDVEKELLELKKEAEKLIKELKEQLEDNKKDDEKYRKVFWSHINALRTAMAQLLGILSEKYNDPTMKGIYKPPED
jgi:hypothetical protein